MSQFKEAPEQEEELSAEELVQFLSFQIGKEVFGLELLHVHEILRLTYITRLPNVDNFNLGVINLRGEIIPIIDLKKRFDQDYTSITSTCRIVVIEHNAKRFGLLVDKVNQVIKMKKTSVSVINDGEASNFNNLIRHVGRNEDELILIVEFDRILPTEAVSR